MILKKLTWTCGGVADSQDHSSKASRMYKQESLPTFTPISETVIQNFCLPTVSYGSLSSRYISSSAWLYWAVRFSPPPQHTMHVKTRVGAQVQVTKTRVFPLVYTQATRVNDLGMTWVHQLRNESWIGRTQVKDTCIYPGNLGVCLLFHSYHITWKTLWGDPQAGIQTGASSRKG